MTIPLPTALTVPPSRTGDSPSVFAAKAEAYTDSEYVFGNDMRESVIPAMNADIAAVNSQAAAVAADAAEVEANTEAVQEIWAQITAELTSGASGTSASSIAIGTGTKSFAASTGKLWFRGMALVVRSAASAANYMYGEVSDYDPGTGALNLIVLPGGTGGSGSHSDWAIYPAGRAFSSGLVRLGSTVTASNNAAIDFTLSGFNEYEIRFRNVIPATDNVGFYLRTSTNGGSSFDSGASDYAGSFGTGAAQMTLATAVGSDTNENGASGIVRIIRPHAATYCQIYATGMFVNASGAAGALSMTAVRLAAADVDAVRFLYSSGNIESGEFTLFGVGA